MGVREYMSRGDLAWTPKGDIARGDMLIGDMPIDRGDMERGDIIPGYIPPIPMDPGKPPIPEEREPGNPPIIPGNIPLIGL